MLNFFKLLLLSGMVFSFVVIIGWLVAKYVNTDKAIKKAQLIVEDLYREPTFLTDDEKVKAITRYVSESFNHQDPAQVPLLRVRPYLTNHRLPSFLRLQSGVIETNIETGLCDNASRMLAFILKQEGFESVQWNMVSDRGGHSALLVIMKDQRQVLVDPFYGVVAVDRNNNLIHPQNAQELLRSGRRLDKVLVTLGKNTDMRFYKEFSSLRMAAEGQDLLIEAKIPHVRKEPILFGKVDGNEKDVKAAARNHKMTPYWYQAV